MQDNDKVAEIMKRWVAGELTTEEADKELEKVGVELPQTRLEMLYGPNF